MLSTLGSSPSTFLQHRLYLLTRELFSSFTEIGHLALDKPLWKDVAFYFPHTPRMFWSKTCKEHNGFFGCHNSAMVSSANNAAAHTASSKAETDTYSTYFRMIVKTVTEQQPQGRVSPGSNITYDWYEMAFLTLSSATNNLMLCFDVPDKLITGLHTSLLTNTAEIEGAYALHVPLLEQVVELYDRSIWDIRDTVRKIEKVFLPCHITLAYSLLC